MCSRSRKDKKSVLHNRKDIEQQRIRKRGLTGKAEHKMGKKVKSQPVTGWRLWLFRIVALSIIPALLFLLVEITLRIAGYGFPTRAIIKFKVNDSSYYCNNVKFTWRFFHTNVAREARSFLFPTDKSDDTYRVFVMGASAAAGTPDGAYSFSRILEVMLREQYPQAKFEVITLAMAAINSHVVVEIAKDCARHEPDLFIVYLGNNEVVGPYGAGTVFTPLSSNLTLIRLGIALKATKLGQLVTNLMESSGVKDVPKIWRGLEMFMEKQVRADEPGLQIVYSHFEKNLQDIRRVAFRSGAKTIFCTVASNLKDNPPFASLHRENLTDADVKNWEEFYQRCIMFEQVGNYTGAEDSYLSAAEIDESFADLQFRLGRCYWQIGEFDKARDRFLRARDLDTLRFRADTRINEIIRGVAGRGAGKGAYLVDVVKVFEDNSPHQIPGQELFYEHVHMNFSGDYLIAEAIFRQVEQILPQRIKHYRIEQRPLCTEEKCARYLAYTVWDRYKIAEEVLNGYIKLPPFTNQIYHSRQVRQMEQELLKARGDCYTPRVLEEVQVQYRWAIQQKPSDWWLHWKYGKFLSDLGNFDAAAEQYRLILRLVPHNYQAYARLGFISGKQGDLDASITHSLKAVQINPAYSDSYYNLALAYYKQGKLDEAAEYYKKVIQFRPDCIEAYTNLGVILERQGLRDEAVKQLRIALKIDPNSLNARKALEAISLKKSFK